MSEELFLCQILTRIDNEVFNSLLLPVIYPLEVMNTFTVVQTLLLLKSFNSKQLKIPNYMFQNKAYGHSVSNTKYGKQLISLSGSLKNTHCNIIIHTIK